MLDGRYPSKEFGELRARIVWDRVAGTIRARKGSRQLAIANAGTIPDRGLYAVTLPDGRRVGELDEEMVYEARPGQAFLLGASTWRIEEIGRDRVIVTPAPGAPGAVPFWKGDSVGRPQELGEAIGAFSRWAVEQEPETLERDYDLDPRAARNLLDYLREQQAATRVLPSERTIVVERFRDEIGDWRLCILSPYGGRVHSAWALALSARIRERFDLEADAISSDDGIVLHLPDLDADDVESLPSAAELVLIEPDEVEQAVTAELGGSALFGARFRENAGRALLIPRAYPGRRTPLWQQRLKSQNLLEVAKRYADFPILLETYRECLRDVLDVPGLRSAAARRCTAREISLVEVETPTASPFASSLLFDYVATYMYEGDTPNAERRAAALSLDRDLLRELLGQEELRELIDPGALARVEDDLQCRSEITQGDRPRRAARRAAPRRRPDRGGGAPSASSRGSIAVSTAGRAGARTARDPPARRRRGALCGGRRGRAVPRRARRRAARGSARGVPGGCARRAARARRAFRPHARAVHGPMSSTPATAWTRARSCASSSAPASSSGASCDPCPPTRASASGAMWRSCVACAEPRWRRCARRSSRPISARVGGLPALLAGRGSPLRRGRGSRPPARGARAAPGPRAARGDLGARRAAAADRRLLADVARQSLRERRGRVGRRGLDRAQLGARGAVLPRGRAADRTAARAALVGAAGRAPRRASSASTTLLRERLARGPAFFTDLLAELDIAGETLREALWDLVWAGEATNDAWAPLRAPHLTLARGGRTAAGGESPLAGSGRRAQRATAGRSMTARSRFGTRRRGAQAQVQGRWSLTASLFGEPPHSLASSAASSSSRSSRSSASSSPATGSSSAPLPSPERRRALAELLLERYGIVTREQVLAEGIRGGFALLYDSFCAIGDARRVPQGLLHRGHGRRAVRAAGRGRAFARWPISDRRQAADTPSRADDRGGARARTLVLAAADPAQPYGAALPWPKREGQDRRPARGRRRLRGDGRRSSRCCTSSAAAAGWCAR